MAEGEATYKRLADLEAQAAHLQTWLGIQEQRQSALQTRIAALEVMVMTLAPELPKLTGRIVELERKNAALEAQLPQLRADVLDMIESLRADLEQGTQMLINRMPPF